MPKRNTTYRVDSTEIQGEGSWVELSYITHGEAQTSLAGKMKDADLLTNHVIKWNWVDSKGKPFGDPQDCLDDLFTPERWFLLSKLFNPDREKAKNSETG